MSHTRCRFAPERLCLHLPPFHDESFTREPKIFDMIQAAACASRDGGVRPFDTGMITECAADSRRLPEPDTP